MQPRELEKEVTLFRRLHAIAGSVYLAWWFLLELLLPHYYNPISNRLIVIGWFALWFTLSFFSNWVRRHLRPLLDFGVLMLTAHFFFLFYRNGGDSNWVVGSFITVMAISYCFLSEITLLLYSLFVLVISVALTFLLPGLATSIFLPGLLTIMLQANIGMRSRLRALAALAQSNEQFDRLFNATFEGVLVHRQRKILMVNDALAQMLGARKEELIGTDMLEIVAPADRAASAERIKAAESTPYEIRGLRKDGSTVEIEVRAKNITLGKELLRLVTVQQIDYRKKIEQERVAIQALAENVRVRDEFISIASHELKTPLTSLKLRTQMIERDLKKNPAETYPAAKTSEFVAIIGRQIDRLSELVESMLDVSRISLGKFHLRSEPVNLAALARESVNLLRAQAEEQGSAIILAAPEEVMVNGDSARLSQVIENLLTNGLKYGNRKPIRIELSASQGMARLLVADSGIGIAPEYLERVFERFERAISSKNISGLGLGLYITRQIVQAHGGIISVQSKLGEGSAFTVSLPLRA